MNNCKSCKSDRIVSFSGKSSDCNAVSYKEAEIDGYVPDDIGIGGGDYVEFSFCLECGQIQGKFPLPDPEFYTSNQSE